MQHFPPETNRRPGRRTRQAQSVQETEEDREDDEPEATIDWLAHVAAGRIQIR